jgi:FixJ family two-component response regulator
MYYIQKPNNYATLREVIRQALRVINENKSDLQKTECEQATKEKFVLSWREDTLPG